MIVDLSGVTFIDSTALGVLVSGAKRVRPRNGNLDIVCTDENIIRIFEITGLDRIFGIFPQPRRGAQGGVRLRERTPRDQQEAAAGGSRGGLPGARTWSSAARKRFAAAGSTTWPTSC